MSKRKYSGTSLDVFKVQPRKISKMTPSKANIKALVKSAINSVAEKKQFNYYHGTSAILNGGTVININQIPQGDDVTNRTGNKVTPYSVTVDYYINGPQSTTTTYTDTGFVALVWDRQPNTTIATFNTVFDTSSGDPGLAFTGTKGFGDRFVVLWKEPYVVQNFAQTATVGFDGNGNFSNVRNTKYIKLDKKQWQCEYASSTTATPTTGALLMVAGSSNNTGLGASSASMKFNARFVYTDM